MIQLKLNNKIIILCGLLFIFQGLFSQTVENVYLNMPDVLNPTLSKQNRLELLEYHKVGQCDSITNRYGSQAYISVFDSTFRLIKVKNTESSTFEIKLFNLNDKTPVVGVISTVCAPVCHSFVQFYDTAWNNIPLNFTMPNAVEWLKNDSLIRPEIDFNWIKNTLKTSFISLSFDLKASKIIATNNSLQFMSEKDRKEIEPFMNTEALVYDLKNNNWKKE